MRIALDTNPLAYAFGVNTPAQQVRAAAVLAALTRHKRVLPAQVAAELHSVLTRKGGFSRTEAAATVAAWMDESEVIPTSGDVLADAFELAVRHRLQVFDAVILAAAAAARCDLLLSEDMQDGFVYRGVTVADPFRTPLHPLLADALQEAP